VRWVGPWSFKQIEVAEYIKKLRLVPFYLTHEQLLKLSKHPVVRVCFDFPSATAIVEYLMHDRFSKLETPDVCIEKVCVAHPPYRMHKLYASKMFFDFLKSQRF